MGNYVFVGLGAYVVLSITLFIFPTILHKKKKTGNILIEEALHSPSGKVVAIAHRGGAREEVENTMEAFKNAVGTSNDPLIEKAANNIHMIECDLQLTKDGVLIVAHDNELDRLCGMNTQISNLNYDEVPPFLNEIELHFANEGRFKNQKQGIKFAKLEEAFQKFPNMMFHIDLKSCTPEIISKTDELIRKYSREHHVVWGGMRSNENLKKINPKVPTFFAAPLVFKTMLLYIFGLLPFFSLPDDVYSGPMFTKDFKKMSETPNPKRPKIFKIASYILRFIDFISGPLFRHLQKRGIPVFLWVLNDEKDFEEALNRGVNGIMTDSPSLLYSYLEENNKYLSL